MRWMESFAGESLENLRELHKRVELSNRAERDRGSKLGSMGGHF
jgi:hypothetical protein